MVRGDLHQRLRAVPPRGGTAPDDRILHLDLYPGKVDRDGDAPAHSASWPAEFRSA